MSDLVVQASGLWKQYHLGQRRERYRTLRDRLVELGAAPFRQVQSWLRGRPASSREKSTFWALKDVSFEVRSGEVVGFVGRNGAGKSTLLKILSRITEPTRGEVRLRGRVGSLLEVGTGFHPELSGRENVYLNGAILGMRRVEINRKFDEIVDFAEIGQFIDTPVKHYSSGMYVRLAFAVAAHLEPEILIVDEVLSVGDASFQRKCIGKMSDVAGHGRTVLFVSHNMTAVQALCSRVIVLQAGEMVADTTPTAAVRAYMESVSDAILRPIATREDRKGDGSFRFTDFWLEDERGERIDQAILGQTVRLCASFTAQRSSERLHVAMNIWEEPGNSLINCDSTDRGAIFDRVPREGVVCCEIERLPLKPGRYFGNLFARMGGDVADWIEGAFCFDVTDGDFYGTGKVLSRGKFLVQHDWGLRPEVPAFASLPELVP